MCSTFYIFLLKGKSSLLLFFVNLASLFQKRQSLSQKSQSPHRDTSTQLFGQMGET